MKRVVVFGLAFWLLGTLAVSTADEQAPAEPPAPKPSAAVQKILDEATQYTKAKQLEPALQASNRALAIAQETKDPVGEAHAQRSRALAFQGLERTAEAVATWRDAATAWERVGDGPGRIEALAAAGLLLALRKSGEADALLAQALALGRAESKRPLAAARALHAAGNASYGRRYLDQAREFWMAALTIREKLTPDSLDVAASLNNLGLVAGKQGDLVAAADYHRRALAIDEKLAPNSLAVATSLNNLGGVAWKQGDLSAAREYFQRALALQEKQAPNSLAVAASLGNLGNVAWRQGDLSAAREYFQRALALQEKQAPNSLNVTMSLNNLGLVAEKQGRLTEAERLARRAWELVRNQAAVVTGDEARQAFGASTADYAANLVRYQLALGKAGPAFSTLEEGRAQALQQLLVERHVVGNTMDSKLWPAYRAALAARDRAEQTVSRASAAEAHARQDLAAKQKESAAPDLITQAQTVLETATKQLAEAQSAYTQARVKADQLWADIKKSAPRAFAPPLTWEQAQKVLPARTLFLAFSVGEEQTHVFALRAGDGRASALTAYSVAITVKEWQRLVEQLRRQITEPAQRLAGPRVSRRLFGKLFPTEVRQAVARAQHLLLSPDGPLWELPFAALVTNAAGPPHYLGEEKPITYTPSLTLFAQSRNDPPTLAKGTPAKAVVVGNPLFDRTPRTFAHLRSPTQRSKTALYNSKLATRNSKLITGERSYFFMDGQPPEPLPGTKAEALAVAQLYDSDLLTEERATEAALRERIEKADVIHLATHGYILPRAMSSGLLLTVPEQEPAIGETNNDGVLQAWEIHSQLKLKAELVVLSACDTGRGHIMPGEGVVGLTRALQYAGARSIVASQWAVKDKSTAKLMAAFHRYLRQGLAKDEALRKAMVLVRQHKATAHPYYWAAFFLMGDPDNPNLGVEGGPR